MARSQIGFHVVKILQEKKLKEREIAGVLEIEPIPTYRT